jgi:hypothetical protein
LSWEGIVVDASQITISNLPVSGGPVVDIVRSQIEHRAMWLGLVFDEAQRAGVDAEALTRAAVRRCGNLHGHQLLDGGEDGPALAAAVFNKLVQRTFAVQGLAATADTVDLAYTYCPLVTGWQRLGLDQPTCATLCDIAMEGDRGIAEAAGWDLDLGGTIATGHHSCELHFQRRVGGPA